ncbi:MAG: N-acetyldiaminopimelate deacetylase [Thermotogota bacterium]|nr:N-acetyldiaminopimelate deacetylase [Thermotogota bacterium]
MTPEELRHLLHMYPEPSGKEYETQKLLLKVLSEAGYSPLVVGETGVLALWSPLDDSYHLFRADIDALPVNEKTGWEYASKNEYMHACGHDVHTAILFGLAQRVSQLGPRINLAFLFQPAEETGGGAARCIEEIKELGIDLKDAVALHVTDEYPLGTVASRAGTLFSSAYEVDVVFRGRPAHVAEYTRGVDAIEVAADFLKKIYSMTSSDILLRFGRINGGAARNIVAAECKLEGTMRSSSWRQNEEFFSVIERLAETSARFYNAVYEVKKGSAYPEVIVDERLFGLLKSVCENLNIKFLECDMKYTGEDFGFFSRFLPTLMFWLGTGTEGRRYGLHHPEFLPPDTVIKIGVEILWNLVTFYEEYTNNTGMK